MIISDKIWRSHAAVWSVGGRSRQWWRRQRQWESEWCWPPTDDPLSMWCSVDSLHKSGCADSPGRQWMVLDVRCSQWMVLDVRCSQVVMMMMYKPGCADSPRKSGCAYSPGQQWIMPDVPIAPVDDDFCLCPAHPAKARHQ